MGHAYGGEICQPLVERYFYNTWIKLRNFYFTLLGRKNQELYHNKKLQRAKEAWRDLKREIQDINDDTASIDAIYKEQTSNSKQLLELKKSKASEAEEMKALRENVTSLNEKVDVIHTMLAKVVGAKE